MSPDEPLEARLRSLRAARTDPPDPRELLRLIEARTSELDHTGRGHRVGELALSALAALLAGGRFFPASAADDALGAPLLAVTQAWVDALARSGGPR